MKLSDVKIGEKFFHYQLNRQNVSDRMYLRIDMDLKVMLPTLTRESRIFSNLVTCLDLATYKVICLNGDNEVEIEYDNVFI